MKSKYIAENNVWTNSSNEAIGYVLRKKKVKKQRLHKLEPKDAQICLEVERVLSLVFAGEVSDPLLRDLSIYAIDSMGQGGSIMVIVAHDVMLEAVDAQEVVEHLKHAQGYLRTLVAQALNRKKVPLIQFKYVGVVSTQIQEKGDHAN